MIPTGAVDSESLRPAVDKGENPLSPPFKSDSLFSGDLFLRGGLSLANPL
jgi:hypothetical protein